MFGEMFGQIQFIIIFIRILTQTMWIVVQEISGFVLQKP